MSESNGVEMSTTNGKKDGEFLKKLSREEKLREAKIEDQITKSLGSLTSEDDKIQFLIKRCVENEKQLKKSLQSQKQFDKVIESVRKEKEQLQQEFNKTILTKSKLESLCRELQKQNKSIKDESFSRIREEEEKRKETQNKFQKSLNEIQTLMNENNDKNLKLKADNQEMTDKFKFILEQYELREQQMEKINKQMDLVQQLSDAKVAKAEMEAQAEREQLQAQKALLETELLKTNKEMLQLKQAEKLLTEQVNIYASKYSEFQGSLKKSHDVFAGYKRDMESMSKKILKLEKETASWRTKAEKANSIAIDLASEKAVRDEHITKTHKQLWHLQKLCRTLQAERTVLIAALKENNIEIPPMPVVKHEKEPEMPVVVAPPQGPDRLEIMTKNCAELKKNLASLQGQLTSIENSGTENTETSNSSTNNKKNKQKNKKNKNGKTNDHTSKEKETELVESMTNLQTTDVEEKTDVTSNNGDTLVESPKDLATNEEPSQVTKETVTESSSTTQEQSPEVTSTDPITNEPSQ
uniref:CSON013095 protein n=1 Tax=Culicoides sonorensis TaxID=179676 RepID=A0A336M6Z4_CULSO